MVPRDSVHIYIANCLPDKLVQLSWKITIKLTLFDILNVTVVFFTIRT